MNGLEVAVLVGAVMLVGGVIAQKLRVSGPIVLLILGGAIGFIPLFDEIQLPPDLVLLLFLPAILYWESINSSLREMRRNLRVIVLQAVPLVLVTAGVVAVIGHAFGLPWSVAIALGAIVAPTDATAMASVAGRLPRRPLTILRAESLINDGTALAVYAVAVTASVAERTIQLGEGVLQFVLAYAGGITIGVAVGFVVVLIRRVLSNRLLANTLSVLTPFLVYLPAELIGVSGVVAVVTAGLVISHYTPRIVDASARTQVFGFWGLTSYLLNGSLFVLVGLELHAVIAEIDGDWETVLTLGLLTALAVMAVRLAWSFTTPYLIRAIDRRPSQRARRVGARQRLPIAWAGFRGAVSLAAALALPTTVQSGEQFPGRNLIIAVTTIVILVTIIVQGSTMGAIVRWARFPADDKAEEEYRMAEDRALTAVLDALPREADRIGAPQELRDLLEREYSERLDEFRRQGDDLDDRADGDDVDREGPLRLALLTIKRETVIGLRDRGEIDDAVMRRIQSRIDLEELRLSRSMPDEG
ncbi:Na+/H+ antiporter [Herbiconiux sp. L3-i23]|uniref:Na+/H+ antiporter n=1 Tax=Herbiconiux sp. L3-i23 TaxID=2905871 RepID=UPI0020550DC4|nr:Na+/H+ antiporter [Herbiconiux sp. L3-i23]BDI22605.1 putative Na(+)/H(+) exchanger [Herbiconiux sp. L3-i23]